MCVCVHACVRTCGTYGYGCGVDSDCSCVHVHVYECGVGVVGRSVGVTIFHLSSRSVLTKLRMAMFHQMTSSR